MYITTGLGALARARSLLSGFWTAATSCREPDPIRCFDTLAARREGWRVAYCGHHEDGTESVQLQCFDDLPETGGAAVFTTDGEVWQHVVGRAREGSPLHIAALALVDRHERHLIEVACGPWRLPS